MIRWKAWFRALEIATVISALLSIIILVLVISIYHQHKKTDIILEKLDTPEVRYKLEKGEIMTNRYRWPCELIRVVDGDTLEAWIHLDFGVKLEAKLRLEGIDTPEIHTVKTNTEEYAKGIKAKEFVEERFKNQGNKFYIETSGKRPGKYGRFVVNVLMPSGEYLDQLLLKAGHAVKQEY